MGAPIAQSTGATQIERQLRIGVAQEHTGGIARELSIRAEDEEVRHRVVPSLMTRIALSVRG